MYRQEKTANPYLDIAEKSRAYDRHTHALITNPHNPISSPPVVAPSVVVYARRRREERNLVKKVNRIHSNSIDEIWRRAHRMEIKNDTQNLKPELHERGTVRSWSQMLRDCEVDFPDSSERKRINPTAQSFFSQSLSRPTTATFSSTSRDYTRKRNDRSRRSESATSYQRPESGMSVHYNSTGTKTDPIQLTPQPQRNRQKRLLEDLKDDKNTKANNSNPSPIPEDEQINNQPQNNENENNNDDTEKMMSSGTFKNSLEILVNKEKEGEDSEGTLIEQISKNTNQKQ